MNRGFSAIGFLVGSLAFIGIAVGVGYIVIEQSFKVDGATAPVAVVEDVQQPVEKPAPAPAVQKSAVVETKASVETKVETPVKPTPTPAKAPAPTVQTGGFFVKKVPAGFVLDATKKGPVFPLSITTEPRAEDPKKLSLCWTILSANDVVLSETDCWPLEKYGTLEEMITSDFSLAPSPEADTFYAYGHNMIKLRFDLVGPGTFQMADGPSPNTPVLGSDDTGVFDYYIPEGANL